MKYGARINFMQIVEEGVDRVCIKCVKFPCLNHARKQKVKGCVNFKAFMITCTPYVIDDNSRDIIRVKSKRVKGERG